jgi:hypothetical protein
VRILTSAGEIPCELGVEFLLYDDLLPPKASWHDPRGPPITFAERVQREAHERRARQARVQACRSFIDHGELRDIIRAIRLYGEFAAPAPLVARKMTLHMESEEVAIDMREGGEAQMSMRIDL